MKTLSAIAERLFPQDTKLLMKARLVKDDELTEKAVKFLQALFAEQHKQELVGYAKQIIERQEKKRAR